MSLFPVSNERFSWTNWERKGLQTELKPPHRPPASLLPEVGWVKGLPDYCSHTEPIPPPTLRRTFPSTRLTEFRRFSYPFLSWNAYSFLKNLSLRSFRSSYSLSLSISFPEASLTVCGIVRWVANVLVVFGSRQRSTGRWKSPSQKVCLHVHFTATRHLAKGQPCTSQWQPYWACAII